MHNYLSCHGLFPTLQSAYRKHHLTESALLRVTNDILRILDSQGEVILVLLDLSAAFDTIDNHILLAILRTYFNVTETSCFSMVFLVPTVSFPASNYQWFYILTAMLRIWSASGLDTWPITLYSLPCTSSRCYTYSWFKLHVLRWRYPNLHRS